jgi:hypothetical protein
MSATVILFLKSQEYRILSEISDPYSVLTRLVAREDIIYSLQWWS